MFNEDKFTIKFRELQDLKETIFNPDLKVTERIRTRRAGFLLKIPLFSLILQKKGYQNFRLIIDNIRIQKVGFGEIVFNCNENRTFNHIVHGTVMLFRNSRPQEYPQEPRFFRKYRMGDHFGEKMQFGQNVIQSARCVSVDCYLLQMDMKHFYHAFSGHFKYEQIDEQVNFLSNIWFFNKVKKSHLQRIYLSSEKEKYMRGNIIFKKGESPGHLLVILDGEVTMYTGKEGRLKAYCIYGRGEVCGAEEIAEGRSYQSIGICTSQYLEVLKVELSTTWEIYQRDIGPDMINSRRQLSSQLRQKEVDVKRLCKSVISFQSEQLRRQRLMQRKRIRTEQEQNKRYQKLDQMKILNSLFPLKVQLKYPKTRRIRQQHIKQVQRDTVYSSKRVSSYVNKDCTYDKEIIVSYLEKKQKMYETAIKREQNYQDKRIVSGHQLKVERSSAVKNQKRKLKYSRRHYSSMHQL